MYKSQISKLLDSPVNQTVSFSKRCVIFSLTPYVLYMHSYVSYVHTIVLVVVKFSTSRLRSQEGPTNVMLHLFGNKLDLARNWRSVATERGQITSKRHNMSFHETSAKTGENVQEVC